MEIDYKRNQPKIEKTIIDILNDKKDKVINKIKNLTKQEFSKIEAKANGNCMFYAILKSIKENEIKHMEMRQIVPDYITQINYDNEEAIFREEKCRTKYEYANKLRKNGAYANDIALEAIAKMTNFLIGIYKSDERYKQNPWTIIDTSNDEYKGIILLHFNQGYPKGTGHYSGI